MNFEPLDCGAVAIGPSWQRNEDGGWLLPERTIGWDVLEWSAGVLLQPDGPDAGKPFRFTDEQVRLLLWWFAVDEEGEFLYRRCVLRRQKGWGKDPLAAALALAGLLGPVEFGGWADDGSPFGKPHPNPWVQVAGVGQDSTKNTMSLLTGLLGGSKRARKFGVDLGKLLVHLSGERSGRIEAVSSSPRALEGARSSPFVIAGEIQHWLPESNAGVEMMSAIQRNLAKSGGRLFAITNAHEPGELSVGESAWDAHVKASQGKTRATDVMYDSLEAADDVVLSDPESLRRGLVAARGDSHWVDVDRLAREIMDPMTSPTVSLRFYLNKLTAADDSWLSPAEWGRCGDEGLVLGVDEPITLAFDGSVSGDHTALVGCRVEDGALFVLGHWDPADEPDGRIDRDKVRARVENILEKRHCVGFYADSAYWEDSVDVWARDFSNKLLVKAVTGQGKTSHAVRWDMRARGAEFTRAVEKFTALVLGQAIRHDGNAALAQHVANCKRRPNRYGFSLRKDNRDSPRKIDLAVAAVLAWLCRQDLEATGGMNKLPKDASAVFAF